LNGVTGPMQGILELRAPAAPSPTRGQERRTAAPRRLRLLVGLLGCLFAAILVVVAVALTGSGTAGPASGAAEVVPRDALAFIDLSTDPGRGPVKDALGVAMKFPSFSRLSAAVLNRVAAIVGDSNSAQYADVIRPWLGKEAALAFLNTPSASADSLLVLDVASADSARAALGRAGAVPGAIYRGVRLLRYPSGTELAFVRHYLVVGNDASVRAAVDASSSAVPSLASDGAYRRAGDGEPADRVLDAYASDAGVRRILGGRGGLLGSLSSLLSTPSLAGVRVALSPAQLGARVWVHTVLDPTLTQVTGRPASSFRPSLQQVIPAGSPFVLDAAGLDSLAPRLLSAASSAGIAAQVQPLLQRLGAALNAEGFDVRGLLSTIFNGETAVAVVPSRDVTRPPSLVVLARTNAPAAASRQLASLEVPLEQLFAVPAAGAGQEPVFNDVSVAGVSAHQLTLTPGLQLDYAVFHGLVVISTSLDGIAAITERGHALGQEQEFRQAMAGSPERVGSLLFLDSSQLLSLGEQMGITRGARLLALKPDLAHIHAVALNSTSGEDDTTAELYLQIP
jgi:Protein of unknown function (DUF3352)